MIEYKTERRSASVESDVIQIYSYFGWQYIGSQDVYSENTRVTGGSISGRDVNLQQTTDTTQYVAIRFQRDTDIAHYAELRDLNNEYDSLLGITEPNSNWIMAFILLSVTGILFPFAIVVLISHIFKKKKYDKACARRREVLRRAVDLSLNN